MLQHLTALAESTGDDLLSLIGQSFDITAQLESLSLPRILLALLTATLCGAIIYLVYRMFYRGVVYSDNFNILVLLITVVTAFIIMTISANLVLSLWGVGAGITAGAGLYFVAIIGTVFVAALYIILTMVKKERRCYLLVVRYGTDADSNVNALLGTLKYKLKNKTQINDRIELTIEIKTANNDTTQLSRFKAIDGVDSVTLLEYNGEYMN